MTNNTYRSKWKTVLALFMTAILMLSTTACGESAAGPESTASSGKTEEKTEDGPPPALAAEVDLPEEVRTMVYPIWALLVTASKDHLLYYGYPDNAKDDNADAFYEPMSILASLIEEKTDLGDGQKTEDGSFKVSEEAFARYATALFNSFGTQEIEAPELPEDDSYAIMNDEDLYPYIFTEADLTGYEAVVIACTKDESNDGYELTAELRDSSNNTVLYEATLRMIPSSFEGNEEMEVFSYSISDITDEIDYKLEKEPEKQEEDSSGIEENGTEAESLDSGEGSEKTEEDAADEGTEDLLENPDLTTSDPSGEIDREEADARAREYSGQKDPSYQGKENLEGQEYYNYTYSDEEGGSHNVLVPTDGSDPIGGKENDDGTWSFDQ